MPQLRGRRHRGGDSASPSPSSSASRRCASAASIFVIFTFGLAELIRQIVTWYETKVTRTVGRYIFLDIGQEQIYWQLLGARRRSSSSSAG